MDIEKELDGLYAQPLDGFTRARDELAARLRASGRTQDADEVRSLRKPTLSAWVMNQLARDPSDTFARLLSLKDEVGRADSIKQSRSAMAKRRSLIAELMREAGSILEASGKKLSGDMDHRIANSLLAASTGVEAAAARSGRLVRDIVPSGFDGTALEGEEQSPEETARDIARSKAERLAHAAEEAEALARKREADAARAASEARRSQELAARLRATADKARERAESARAKAESALARLDG